MKNNKQLKAIMCVGVSGSGKSTWAKQFVQDNPDTVIVCRDDIRTHLMGGTLNWAKWNWKREDEVTEIQWNMISEAFHNMNNVIIADTNLPVVKEGRVMFSNGDKLAKKLSDLGFEVTWMGFDITLDEAIKRDANRNVSVGAEVITRQYRNWLAYKAYKQI